jgi:hypothetical protein
MAKKQLEKLKKVALIVWNNGFFLVAIVVLVSLGTTYLLLDVQSKNILIEQMLHREQLSVRAGERSVEAFFDLYNRAFIELATNDDIETFSPKAGERLGDYMTRWQGTPIAGVVLIDTEGEVKFNGNRNKVPEVGGYLGDRQYFSWAKTAHSGEVLITPPVISRLGASAGKYILNVSSPIFDSNGEFNGLLSTSVIIEELTDLYIKPLKITDSSFEYLLNENGDVLATDQEGIIGLNFFDQLNKVPFLGSTVLSDGLKKAISSRAEGKIRVAYPVNLESMIPKKMLVAYASVEIGGNYFVLATATPEEDALVFLTPIYVRSIGIIAGAFFVIVLLGIRVAKVRGYKEAVADEHKIHNINN